jgi:hypothetical protein
MGEASQEVGLCSSQLDHEATPLSLECNHKSVVDDGPDSQKQNSDPSELISTITHPTMFAQEMASLDLDTKHFPFGKIPNLSKPLLLLRMIRELLQKPSPNSIEQNRLITLSKQFFHLIPHQAKAVVNLIDVFVEFAKRKMMERLLEIETIQNEITKAGGMDSFRETLSARLHLVPLDCQRKSFQEMLKEMQSPLSIKNIWQLSNSPPHFETSSNRRFLFYVPPFSSVASQLLTGIRPMTLEGYENPVIHLFSTAERAVSNMNLVRLSDQSLAGIVYFVEAALGKILSRCLPSLACPVTEFLTHLFLVRSGKVMS